MHSDIFRCACPSIMMMHAASLLDADKIGATCAESEALAAPLPRNSLRDCD